MKGLEGLGLSTGYVLTSSWAITHIEGHLMATVIARPVQQRRDLQYGFVGNVLMGGVWLLGLGLELVGWFGE